MDGNGDGIGDFRGLTMRLNHLAGLGVTCLWLLPFYPSPNRDDGYDIADYYGVNPRYGSLGDFVEFLRQARQRGMKVIIDLVVNHTSDQHPSPSAAILAGQNPTTTPAVFPGEASMRRCPLAAERQSDDPHETVRLSLTTIPYYSCTSSIIPSIGTGQYWTYIIHPAPRGRARGGRRTKGDRDDRAVHAEAH
jgi:hypothetical protein